MLKKICGKCEGYYDYGTKCLNAKCNEVSEEQKARDKARYKIYHTKRMLDEEQKKFHTFYSSKDWTDMRQNSIIDTLGIDVYAYYTQGLVVQGFTVHHIECLADDWSLRLYKDNLIYLSQSSHMAVHMAYNTNKRSKIDMQLRLVEYREKFRMEFL